jgi:hypothetical protein
VSKKRLKNSGLGETESVYEFLDVCVCVCVCRYLCECVSKRVTKMLSFKKVKKIFKIESSRAIKTLSAKMMIAFN